MANGQSDGRIRRKQFLALSQFGLPVSGSSIEGKWNGRECGAGDVLFAKFWTGAARQDLLAARADGSGRTYAIAVVVGSATHPCSTFDRNASEVHCALDASARRRRRACSVDDGGIVDTEQCGCRVVSLFRWGGGTLAISSIVICIQKRVVSA